MYSGNIVNLDLSVEQIINKTDKVRKTMSIIAFDHSNGNGNNSKIISPYIICPICKEHARYELKDYRIKIFNCKNGHVVNDILLKDFENTQMIDESLIICDKCKTNNKSNTYNKEMYKCNECNMNLCPLCKSSHDKKHKIINYDQKYFICNIHNKEYNSYCETCNKDICILCKKDHKEHEFKLYDDIIQEDTLKEEQIKVMFYSFSKGLKTKMSMIIDRINNVMKNIELYYNLIERNMLNYNINSINYNIIQNINDNYKNFENINEILDTIIFGNTYKDFIPKILKIYNEINKNEISLIYSITNNKKEIKIFGEEFVKNNKDLCKIIYDNKEYDLTEKFDCKDIKDQVLNIKLKGINNVNDLSFMFERCSSLESLVEISNLNTNYVLDMKYMFSGCSSIKMLPDISDWNTSNAPDMKGMFSGCSSLKSLPDISKWDISFALDCKAILDGLKGMFDGCSESLNIPEKFKNIE